MEDSEERHSTESRPGLACGSCGAPVQPSDVTCPACGVLLAAYQAPVGAVSSGVVPTSATISTVDETSATHDVPSPSMSSEPAGDTLATSPLFSTPSFSTPAFHPPPVHQPRSQSPIGDALQQSRDFSDAHRAGNAPAQAGPDELSRMADSVDELSDMADGVDELAEMAAGGDTTLARQVEAELAGAKVRFDGARPVIETGQVEITQTPGDEPAIVEAKPRPQASNRPAPRVQASGVATAPPVVTRQEATRRPSPSIYDDPVRPVRNAMDVPGPDRVSPTQRRGFEPATVVRWIPFIVVGCFLLGFGQMIPRAGAVIGFVIVIALIYGLLRFAAASSRKTTSMPRDDTWNRKGRR